MQTGADHSADYKALAVVTMALISGILLFSIAGIVLHYIGAISNRFREDSPVVFNVVLAISLVIIITTRLIYIRRVNALKETNSTSREKLDIFRSITITHMVLCEFTALLSIICFLVFGYFLFFIIVAVALAEMFIKFPTHHRIESVVNSGTF